MSAWVPLFQTLVWAGLIVAVLVFLREPLKVIAKAISDRVAGGSGFEASVAGAFGIKIYELQELKHVDPVRAVDGTPPVEAAWTESRDEQKRTSRELYLVHVISPSRRGSGWFDILSVFHPDLGSRGVGPDQVRRVGLGHGEALGR
jgi:hypothetical protein